PAVTTPAPADRLVADEGAVGDAGSATIEGSAQGLIVPDRPVVEELAMRDGQGSLASDSPAPGVAIVAGGVARAGFIVGQDRVCDGQVAAMVQDGAAATAHGGSP